MPREDLPPIGAIVWHRNHKFNYRVVKHTNDAYYPFKIEVIEGQGPLSLFQRSMNTSWMYCTLVSCTTPAGNELGDKED